MTTVTYRFGDFTLSRSTRELCRGDTPIAISPRAFDCLAYLIEHRDRAVGKDELVAAIWERVDVSDTQLGQAVLRARRAVDDDGQIQNVIRTVSRFGYRWVAEVVVVEETAPPPLVAVADPAPPREINYAAPAVVDDSPIEIAEVTARRSRARQIVFALLAIALIGAMAIIAHRVDIPRNFMAARESASAVVLPMHVAAADDSAWLRLGVMDLVAQRLRAGGVAVPPSENTVALLQSVDANDAAAMQRVLRRETPTALIVSGDIAHADEVWKVDLRATAADGTVLTSSASHKDALDAARDAADGLLGRLGRAQPPAVSYASGVEERLQRAQAAMLNNDLDAARAILVSDPDLAHAEPELGYRLAMIDFRAGQQAHAEAALTSLLAEPAAQDPLFHARLLDGRGAVRIRQDNFKDAERDYDAAINLLKDGGNAPELGRALTGRGVSRAMRHDFAPALADLGQARVQLEEAGDVLAVARVDSNQGGLEMNRDRPQDAIGYLESAASVFERYGAVNELMETLESLVSNRIVLLQPAEALAASDRSWTLAARVTDPNQHLNLIEDRVDVFLALGRLREAGALLSTLPDAAIDADPFVARRLPALRARLALATSDPQRAMSEARRALAMPTPSDDAGEGIAEIALVYQRAALADAHPRPVSAPSAEWIDSAKPIAYPVQALAAAEWAASSDDGEGAGRLYQQALDMAESRGVPIDVASVSASYGPWLIAHGQTQRAGEVIGRVAPWAQRDYDCALLQARLFHALGQSNAWTKALAQAQALAGERELPADLRQPPQAVPESH